MGEKKTDSPSILRQALMVNKKPFPWLKAFLAGLAAGLPIAIGLFFGSLQSGLIAGLGGFTFLYVFPMPYVQLAKKLAWCVLGIITCVFLGTLLAPYPIITAIFMGIIGAISLFIFGAFRLIGPSALFFVLVFAMVTGMPVAPEEALSRAGLALLGGVLSWGIAMSGWLFNPYGPEKNIVKRSYLELANYFDMVGTELERNVQIQTLSTLKEASETIASGYSTWKHSDLFNHLAVLNNYAHKIYLLAVEHQIVENKKPIPAEVGDSLRALAKIIDSKNMHEAVTTHHLIQLEETDGFISKISLEINAANKSLLESSVQLKKQEYIKKTSAKRVLLGVFDKNSVIFIHSLRFATFTAFAAIFAFEFDFNRSFWVPLSCVAVMSGATVVASIHRAVQRSIGTIFGILIASGILVFHPTGYLIPLLIFLFTFITELFIVKNYGLAALSFTPAALIMAEAGSLGDGTFSFFASARLVDVLIGVIIGLIGVWFGGRKSASSRLPHIVSKTIRTQAQVFFVLFSNQEIYRNDGQNIEFNKMETNIRNLKTVFDTARGEVGVDQKMIDNYLPILYSIEELGFLLDKCAYLNIRPILQEEVLGQYLVRFEGMAVAISRENHYEKRTLPALEGFESIADKIGELQSNIHNFSMKN